MKKFFHRFSAVERGGGVETLVRHQQHNGDSMVENEKMPLQDGPTPMNRATSGDRVKALAARFENLSGSDQKLQKKLDQQPTLTPRTSSHRKSNAVKVNDIKEKSSPSLPPSVPPPKDDISPTLCEPPGQAQEKPLHSNKLPHQEVDNEDTIGPSSSSDVQPVVKLVTATSSPPNIPGKGQDESAAIAISFGNTPASPQGILSKTVAFAPSPKKPSRPSSPPPGMSISDGTSSMAAVGNFAKATLASTARAKSITRQQAAVEAVPAVLLSQPTASTSQPTSRPNSSLSASRPQPRRSISSTGALRRGSGNDNVVSTSNIKSLQPHSMATSHGFAQGTESLPNSIPFTSAVNASNLRSDSPQSIGTNSSKAAGHSAASNLGSRPGSWIGRVNSNGSASQGWASNGAKSIGAPSWSEMTQEDLVSNLGARERTRQEVLWEIVASEERYVKELERTKEFYADALLSPSQVSPPVSPRIITRVDTTNTKAESGYTGLDYLGMDVAALSAEDRVRRDKEAEIVRSGISSPKSIKSSKSLSSKRWSSSRLIDQNNARASSQIGYANSEGLELSVPLPTSLRITLEAISNGLVQGHLILSEALKRRYEEQWPLVRSLADVFARHADVLHCYKDYVVHLERALECLEEAALMERAMRGKRIKKEKLTVMVGLGRAVASLESAATERGECSLAIFLAMPFQRLLKYPLLFQNLLFHTDASTYEFESTVKMVVDVENMIRSIEDEKIDKDERDKVLDGFARIEGIKDRALLKPKRDRVLIEERALYEENPRRAISESNEGNIDGNDNGSKMGIAGVSSHNAAAAVSSSGALRTNLKSKRSYRRLSDFLTVEDRPDQATKAPNLGSKKDLWLVRFSDVELKCQRVGVTALPMVSSVALQQPECEDQDHLEIDKSAAVMTEEEVKIKEEFKRSKESKERMKALRNMTLRSKTRNLYKFVSVTSWKQIQKETIVDSEGPVEGLTATQEVDEEEDEDEDDDRHSSTSQETDAGVLDTERYVRQSKLSFSYWGQDKVEPKPVAITRTQSQYGSSVSAFRSSPHLTKRHSLTPPSASTVPSSPAISSPKVVACNSHAKAKMDKFGNRLRQTQEGSPLSTNQRMTSSSRLAGASKTSVVEGIPSQQQRAESPILMRSKELSVPIQQSRASLPQNQSIDSNLRMISSFIANVHEGSDESS